MGACKKVPLTERRGRALGVCPDCGRLCVYGVSQNETDCEMGVDAEPSALYNTANLKCSVVRLVDTMCARSHG